MKAYMARQPIYTEMKSIFGYELLYRADNGVSGANVTDDDVATKTVVSDAVMAFGLERLTNGKKAFINFGRSLLINDLVEMLDKDNFIIEILETVEVDDKLIASIKEKHEAGYIFALDDYIGDERFEPLMPYVSIIKVDFSLVKGRALRKLSEKLIACEKKLLAEKVETIEDYETAKNLGYTLFQGYYFDKPIVLTASVASVQSSTCSRLFNTLSADKLSFEDLAEIIKTDVNLTYRLMKHTNSLQFYRGNEINSVHLALVSMGVEEVKRWVTLVFLRDISGNDSDENTKDALVRALLAEWIAKKSGINTEIAFLMGMFSMIDIIANDNLQNIINQLAVANEIKDALFGKPGQYTDILNFVCAYENGDWEHVMPYATLKRLPIDELSRIYMDAVNYADNLFD